MFFANSIWCWVLIHLSKTLHRISEYKKPLHARDWWLLHHWPGKIVSMENFPSWFETLRKSHLIVTLSTFQTCRTSALKWDFHLFDGVQSVWVILSHEIDASNVEVINIRQIIDSLSMFCIASSEELSNTFRNRSVTLFKNDLDLGERFDSVPVSDSISSSMTNLSSTGPNISPDSHTWEDSLSSMFHSEYFDELAPNTGPTVLVCCTLNELRGTFWLSDLVFPGFPMQSKQARSDPSRCIVRQNSSSALTLLWLFFHLHLLVFFSTSLQDYWWNWNGWCWTNTKDDSIHHVWNFPWSKCMRIGSWCQHIWFGSCGPNWFYQTTNQEQLCGSR